MKVKYIGFSHVREINKADFARAQIDQSAVRFHQGNNWVVKMSPEGAEFLLSTDHEFREATSDDELVRDMTRSEVLNTEAGEAAPIIPINEEMVVSTTEGPRQLRTRDGKKRSVKASSASTSVPSSVGVAGQVSVASSTGTTSSGTSGTSGSTGSGSIGSNS